MTRDSNIFRGAAALCIGIAFAAHVFKAWWLESHIKPVAEPNLFAYEEIVAIIDSPLWVVSGVLHLVVAVALSLLAVAERNDAAKDSNGQHSATIAAAIGSGSFLFLSMTHLVGTPQIGELSEFCAADGRSLLIAYNLIKTVLLASAFFALGWFLLIDSVSKLRAGAGSRLINAIGFVAGLLCVLFVFLYSNDPLLVGSLTMAAVALWGSAWGLSTLLSKVHSAA